jgi:cellulose biosynthesis protein BcsQ
VGEPVAPVIGVVGGSGGVGASTFAAGLARLAAPASSAGRAVLVEIDPTSGGIDVLLGMEAVPGPRWSGLRLAGGRLEPAALTEGLPAWSSVAFVAADVTPSADAVAQLLPVAKRVGPVVVDLPRWATPARSAALAGCDLVVLIAGSDVATVAAARRVAADLGLASRVAVVVRGGCAPLEVANLVGAPLVGRVPTDVRSLSADPASWPAAMRRVAAGVLDAWTG